MTSPTSPLRACPIARSLTVAGDLWSVLILRDALYGLTRFDEFQSSLKIAPNILSQRLKHLEAEGMLERRRYQTRPVRHEYILTEKGRAFRPVLWALLAWGNDHLCPEGHLVDLIDPATGVEAQPVMVDAKTLRPLSEGIRIAAGPAATPGVVARYGKDGIVA